MILTVKNPFSNELGKIQALTIEDFRSISFIVENSSDNELDEFLSSKIEGTPNVLTKLLLLMQARMQFVSEQITFHNGTANVTIDLKLLWKELNNNIKSVYRTVEVDGYKIEMDYPISFLHTNVDDVLVDCIYSIWSFASIEAFNFKELNLFQRRRKLNLLPAKVILKLKDELRDMSNSINIFKSRANLPDIDINLFDNSAFVFIRALFSYYSYDDITELIFMLSRRIQDLAYLNSRTPRDLELFIRLYSEEIEKANLETKSTPSL